MEGVSYTEWLSHPSIVYNNYNILYTTEVQT